MTDNLKLKCDGPILENEAKMVIKNMKNNKTPGSDGFPVEFYKFFWKDIGVFLLNSYHKALVTKELSITQKQGVITCLPKGDKPREFLKNWRQITLLNVDYKILSGIVAYRMKQVLPHIISDDQKGFLKNRYIRENIRTVYDIMHELEKRGKSGLILLIDFEKAFDSVEWSYINKVLKAYNFGESFLNWVNIIYKNSCSCVINNGNFSEFFKLGRSCRQGDPLSPYLFILAIEPLANEIKRNPTIKGIKIGENTYKIGQYADDTYLLLDGSEASLREAMDSFDKFAECSGLRLNIEKTHVIWLGCLKNSNRKLCLDLNLQWSTSFTLLGIQFFVEMHKIISVNYTNKLTKIMKILDFYNKLNLSLVGKITVIKTLIIPKLVYLFTVLPAPHKSYVKELENIFRAFIWNNKKPRITLNQLEKDISDGGLKLTNINAFCSALKLSWIKRLCTSQGNWQSLFECSVTQEKSLIWNLDCQSTKRFAVSVTNLFWQDVLNSWWNYKSIFENEINIRTYPIWNSYFLLNDNIIQRKDELVNKGIYFINDLLDEQGQFYGYQEFIEKYQLQLNFVDFYSLTHSIPRKWRTEINNQLVKLHDANLIQKCVKDTIKALKVCRSSYWKFIDLVKTEKVFINKWNNILEESFTKDEWKDFFQLNFKATIENKLRAFQYKILTRVLPTKRYLMLCNISVNDICYFCEEEVETIEHLFWKCVKVQELLAALKPLISLSIQPFFQIKHFIIGIKNIQNEKLVNHIFMIIKRYIYVTKCMDKNLNLLALLSYIKFHYTLEKNLIIKNNKNIGIFQEKWALLVPVIDTWPV